MSILNVVAGYPGSCNDFHILHNSCSSTSLSMACVGKDICWVKSHPGIIVAIIVVAFLAFLAAVFIVKKYCFTESNVTYRYSVLRSYQEADDLGNSTTNRLQNDDSDEDLLD
ncbi:sortilin-like isoform X2 [Rhinatrema bivittatum]|uniref:sortilin-like isoform X2 n=1 Tax=Rhinatrema bivittatum TaxID=194408 RepID=UPI0011263BEB|nr:sortilin-like isoform X2 [Rhinatrema bivittatum]